MQSGDFFLLSPLNISPIHPITGFALGILLIRGWALLPSIIIGIFSYQFLSIADTINPNYALVIIDGISFSLQAILGYILTKRYIGENNALIHDIKIIYFLLLIIPLSSLIATTFNTNTVLALDVIKIDNRVLYWITKWISYSFGAIIFTPLILIFLGKPRKLWKKRQNQIVYPILILLGLIVVIFFHSEKRQQRIIKKDFYYQQNKLQVQLHEILDDFERNNKILQGLFNASYFVSATAFKYYNNISLIEYEKLQTQEWIAYKKISQQKYGYFSTIQRQGLIFKENIKANNKLNDSMVIKLLIEAGENNQDTVNISSLNQGSYQNNTIEIYSPVYYRNRNLQTQADKKQALRGFVVNKIQLEKILQHIADNKILIKIQDEKQVFYNDFESLNDFSLKDWEIIDYLKIANKHLQISYLPSEYFLEKHQYWNRWWIIFGALLLTSLINIVLLMLTGRTLKVEELVKTKTLELHQEVKESANISKILHAIASNMQLKKMLQLIVKLIEIEDTNLIVTILLMDEDGKNLKLSASDKMPSFYHHVINNLNVSKQSYPCSQAAYLRQRIINETFFQKINPSQIHLARKANLHTVISEPIINSEDKILGVLSFYYSKPKKSYASEFNKIKKFSELSSFAIEKKTSAERINYLAFYDELTKLPNRRLLYDRLKQELASVDRYHSHGVLMFLDLDHFKALNDSLGHDVGDELLIQVAKRLRNCVRDEDTISRLGGDEFIVLLKTSTTYTSIKEVTSYALEIAKRIQASLYLSYSLPSGNEHIVTSSIGVTFFSEKNKKIEVLLKQADTAMYAAKQKGRNTFSFYNKEMEYETKERLSLERDIEVALEKQQFELHYQLQYNEHETINSAHAILNWQHPQRQLLSYNEFIDFCDGDLILAIDAWILKTAVAQLHKIPALKYISVNITAQQFYHSIFIEQLTEILQQNEISEQMLMLVLTEEIIMKDKKSSAKIFDALKKLGVGIAINNVGQDNLYLSHFNNLLINQIKIECNCIQGINKHEDSLVIEAIIMLTKHLNLSLVVSGIETQAQVKFLQEKNCDIYQGTYFSKDLIAEELDEMLIPKSIN